MGNSHWDERIAKAREAKHRYLGKEIPKAVLDEILSDDPVDKERQSIFTKYLRSQREGVVGVTKHTHRKDGTPIRKPYRANIKTPNGQILRSSPFATWREAVNKRNRWASSYYPGRPEYRCSINAARKFWGIEEEQEEPVPETPREEEGPCEAQ